MRLEVLKFREVSFKDGSKRTILDIVDLKRIVYLHQVTLSIWKNWGFSRNTWDNTLSYYGLSEEDLREFREQGDSSLESKSKLHNNSTHGCSLIVDTSEYTQHTNSSKLKAYLDKFEAFDPGITKTFYYGIRNDPTELSKYLFNLGISLREYGLILKSLRNRVRKVASNRGLPYYRGNISIIETQVYKILLELGVEDIEPQFYIKPYHFDFYLPKLKTFIEVDGGKHTGTYDDVKEEIVKNRGEKLIRLKLLHEISKENYERVKNQIRRKLGCKNRI
jgi:very-short-patch-repair endonuclease